MQEIAPKLLTLMLWVRFLSQVNMLICPTHISVPPCDNCDIFCPYSASLPIKRVNWVAFERTDGVFFFNIVVVKFVA